MEKYTFAIRYKTEESLTGWKVLFSVFQHICFEIAQQRINNTDLLSTLAHFVQRKVLKALMKKIYLITNTRRVLHNSSKLVLLLFPWLKLEYPQVLIACMQLVKNQPFVCIHSTINLNFLTHLSIQAELLQNTKVRINSVLINVT